MLGRLFTVVCLAGAILAACGGGGGSTGSTPSVNPNGSASANPDGSGGNGGSGDSGGNGATARPSATPAGASLTIRATGAATVCKSFSTIANCAAFVRVQGKSGTPKGSDLAFTGDPLTAKTLTAPADAPATIAPGTWRISAHLDRVDAVYVMPPATPQRWVDRACHTDAVISKKVAAVDVRVDFNSAKTCAITVLIDGKPAPTPKS